METTRCAFLFPGQGSQKMGMGLDLARNYPEAHLIFEKADEILHYSISRVAWEGPVEELDNTINTQPALLAHSAACLTVLQDQLPELTPMFIAGHSMGEISALIAAGVSTLEYALQLVHQRGILMDRSGRQSPGGMAAILGLDIPILDSICNQASSGEDIVQVANDNCPGQVVISGTNPALERAVELAQIAGARKTIRLPVSIAAHSPLMASAQKDFTTTLNTIPFNDPSIPLISNVTAQPLLSQETIRQDLQDQLTHRVRWNESIQYMIRNGVNTFIEIGSGSVLTGLVKRISREVTCFSIEGPRDIEQLAASIRI